MRGPFHTGMVFVSCLLLGVTLLSWLVSYGIGWEAEASRKEMLTSQTASFRRYHVSVLYGRVLLATFNRTGPTKPGQAAAASWDFHQATDGPSDTFASGWLHVLDNSGVSFLGLGFVAGSDLPATVPAPVEPFTVNMVGLTLPHWLLALLFAIAPWRAYRRGRRSRLTAGVEVDVDRERPAAVPFPAIDRNQRLK